MKTAIILRFIILNRKLGNPGFDDPSMVLLAKFEQLDNSTLLSMYENVVTMAFKAGEL